MIPLAQMFFVYLWNKLTFGMKRLICTLIVVSGFAASAFAQTRFVYTDATTLPVFGKVSEDTFEPFSRLPLSLKDKVGGGVWEHGRCSSGLFIRFRSDAGKFNFKWTSTLKSDLDNMTGVGVRGMALYVLDEGDWNYVSPVRANMAEKESTYTVKASRLDGGNHEYMLYLSLYDGVLDLQIGVPEGKKIEASTMNSPRAEKPVIAYGTSILQGASASNTGMCGSAQLSRKIDRVVINLGFSGNCLLDAPIAEYMASYPDPGVFILDSWNGGAIVGKNGLEKCIRILRAAHPKVPILVVDMPLGPNTAYDDATEKEYIEKIEFAEETVKKLKKEGDKNIYHINIDILGPGNSGTCDGAHFNDVSFTKWVDTILPYIKKAYR